MENLKTVLRIKKIKTFQALKASEVHCKRLKFEENVNPERTKYNRDIIHSENLVKDLKDSFKNRKIRVRKNGVICLEVVLTLTKETFKSKKDLIVFINQSKVFLNENFGKENILDLVLHLDESTPHLHAHVIPIDSKGKLNAREVTSKDNLENYQNDYLKKMKLVNSNLTYNKKSKDYNKTLSQYGGEVNKMKEVIENFKNENEIQKNEIKNLKLTIENQNKEISKLKLIIEKIKGKFLNLKKKNDDKIVPKLEFEEIKPEEKQKQKKKINNNLLIDDRLNNQMQKDIESLNLDLSETPEQKQKQNHKNNLNFKI